ncbi:ABC transporter permease subunit [Streptococcus sp. 2A/TPW/M5]
MSLPCVVPSDCLTLFGLLWAPQFLNWWLGVDIDHWSKFVFVLVAMFLLFAAMISEVFKAAYLAIPKGQMEAGLSIGLTPAQTIWRIVLPKPFA